MKDHHKSNPNPKSMNTLGQKVPGEGEGGSTERKPDETHPNIRDTI